MTTIRSFHTNDIPALTTVWNSFWAQGSSRAFSCQPGEFAERVVLSPAFSDTTLLVAEDSAGSINGFAHFGLREDWWFHPEDRHTTPETGSIYALCASEEATLTTLLQEAEAALSSTKSIWLFPTWAQGAVPFYNGLTPSNEVSGLWINHPLIAWGISQGYSIGETYELGTLPRSHTLQSPPIPAPGTLTMLFQPFSSPILLGAMRFDLRLSDESIGHVIVAPNPERERATGICEWAAFDVAVVPLFQGKLLMYETITQVFLSTHADVLQLHVVKKKHARCQSIFPLARF